MSDNIIQLNQDLIHTELKDLVKNSVEETLNAMLDAEADKLVQAERYARDEQRQGYRAGHYDRSFATTAGEVNLRMPKLKGVAFETAIIERYRRRESSVEEALIEMYLAGVSVRRVEDITEALWGTKVSPGTISNLNKKAYENIEKWRNRPLSSQAYPYVYVDGIFLKRCWGEEFENVSILIAIGVTDDGYREILGAAEGLALAKIMVNIGNKAGKITRAVITNMDKPLGYAVGNAIEVKEAVEILKGNGDKELKEICIELASNMLYIAGRGSLENCKKIATAKLENGDAFETFKAMVQAHGGDTSYVDDPEKFPLGKFSRDVKADKSGYIVNMDCEKYGLTSLALGAGRNKKEDNIDFAAGLAVRKKTGDFVEVGDVLATLYTSDESKLDAAEEILKSALSFGDVKPPEVPIILGRVK